MSHVVDTAADTFSRARITVAWTGQPGRKAAVRGPSGSFGSQA